MIRFGIIGYGYMGQFHKKKIVQSGQASVVAILDKEQRRREEGLSDGYHVYSERQLETFFKETMDLVIVATKIEERAYYATQAMTAGFHVLCEKPVAMNMKELEEIIAISDKTGKKFTVHQPRRFDRDYLMLKEVIDSHVIGDVHTIESRVHGERGILFGWRGREKSGGGLLNDWGTHLIDQYLQLFPEEKVIRIECRLRSILVEDVEDYVELNLTFSNNVYAKIVLTTFALCEMPRWFALGNRGTLRLDDMTGENGSIVRLKTEVDVEELSKRGSVAPSLTLAPLDNLYKEKIPLPNEGDTTMCFWNSLIAALKGEGEFLVKTEDTIRQMKILEAARLSSETNQSVDVNI